MPYRVYVCGGSAGIACSMFLAEMVYDVSANIILDSCVRAVAAWDIITSMLKSWVFGTIISVVRSARCPWAGRSLGHACAYMHHDWFIVDCLDKG